MPEGTKPYICPEEGCGKSFRTGSKLRTHSKVHDQNRYVCMHPSHLAACHQSELRHDTGEKATSGTAEDYEEDEEAESSQQTFPRFATWSALQEHNKLEHPPTCPHPECDGRIFKSNKKLRKHCIKVHLETIGHTEDEGDTGTADETDHHDGGDAEKIQDLELGGIEFASIESGRSIAQEESHCVSQQEVEAQTPFAASFGEKESASYSSSFGGRERKRKAGPSPTPRIIPMQSIPFEAFDGSGDYSCDANDTGVDAAQRQDKRVRFV